MKSKTDKNANLKTECSMYINIKINCGGVE